MNVLVSDDRSIEVGNHHGIRCTNCTRHFAIETDQVSLAVEAPAATGGLQAKDGGLLDGSAAAATAARGDRTIPGGNAVAADR